MDEDKIEISGDKGKIEVQGGEMNESKKEYANKLTLPTLFYGLLLIANIAIIASLFQSKFFWIIQIIIGLIIGSECYLIAKRDKRGPIGIASIGFLFGFVGLLYVFLTSKIKRFELLNFLINLKTKSFLKQKRVQTVLMIVLILTIIIFSSLIRTQNLSLLKDSTTGEYIPLALDPFYFLRIAETLVDNGGILPEIDSMRALSTGVPFIKEILPQTVYYMYKIANLFGDFSIQFIDVISPVIFFILGLVAFFFLIYFLTKSKTTALLSSLFLSIIPTYVYRTMAGFSDHEAIGMFAFLLALGGYSLGVKFLNKEKNDKKYYTKLISWSIVIGFLTAFTVGAWAGISNFLFMIIPLSFFIMWAIQVNNKKENDIKKYLIFFLLWISSSLFFSCLFGYSFSVVINRFILSTYGLINLFVLGVLISEFIILKSINKNNFLYKKREKYGILVSISLVILAGIVFLILRGENFFSILKEIFQGLYDPFGNGRVGSTVAENNQTDLVDLISQIGKSFFWIFMLGAIIFGVEIAKGVKNKKNKYTLIFFWTLFIAGTFFSRYSSSSILNGSSFLSKLFYFGGLGLLVLFLIKIYSKDEIKINKEKIIMGCWIFFMIIAGMGSVRLLFVITPLIVFIGCYSVERTFNYYKTAKDEFSKMILIILLIGVIIGLIFSGISFYKNSKLQGEYTGPSANKQWQQAMSWVRKNTPKEAIFVHWWDYGYWVQYLGERPTLADGGHFQGSFRTHMIGRYVLTNPEPEIALSFMKSNNVSYLLIDQTDLGKYGAYSKIGSDEEGTDRLSSLPIMTLDKSQTQETQEITTRVYQIGAYIDEDIIYDSSNGQIFLPGNKAILGAIVLEIKNEEGDENSINQARGIFIYNDQQIHIPIRYTYINGNIIDFGGGLDAIIYLLPKIESSSTQSIQIEDLAAGIYLSPKVSKSLFAQLYLMDDPFNNYPTISLSHIEPDPLIDSLKNQGADIDNFAYFNEFLGPIKIWKVEYPNNILAKEEFLRTSGKYAEFDNINVVA